MSGHERTLAVLLLGLYGVESVANASCGTVLERRACLHIGQPATLFRRQRIDHAPNSRDYDLAEN